MSREGSGWRPRRGIRCAPSATAPSMRCRRSAGSRDRVERRDDRADVGGEQRGHQAGFRHRAAAQAVRCRNAGRGALVQGLSGTMAWRTGPCRRTGSRRAPRFVDRRASDRLVMMSPAPANGPRARLRFAGAPCAAADFPGVRRIVEPDRSGRRARRPLAEHGSLAGRRRIRTPNPAGGVSSP